MCGNMRCQKTELSMVHKILCSDVTFKCFPMCIVSENLKERRRTYSGRETKLTGVVKGDKTEYFLLSSSFGVHFRHLDCLLFAETVFILDGIDDLLFGH